MLPSCYLLCVCFVCVCLISQKNENVLFIFECHPLLSSYGIYICMSNGCMYVYILYMYGIYLYTYIHLYITRAPAQGIATLANESNVVMGSGWRRPTVYRGGRWRCVCVSLLRPFQTQLRDTDLYVGIHICV